MIYNNHKRGLKSLHCNLLGVIVTDVNEMNKPYGRYKTYERYKYKYKSYAYEEGD